MSGSKIVLVARWWCNAEGCDAKGGPGEPAVMDREARLHTEKPPKHPTTSASRPVPVSAP